jgi:hypothetical protein
MCLWMVPETGIEPVRPLRKARDFKSLVSTNFTTRAVFLCGMDFTPVHLVSSWDVKYFG